MLIIDQIRSRKVLRTLCLTNKLFNREFTVFLYRELDVPVDKIDPASPHLVYTRTLIVTPESSLAQDKDGLNKTAQRVLARTRCLESFV